MRIILQLITIMFIPILLTTCKNEAPELDTAPVQEKRAKERKIQDIIAELKAPTGKTMVIAHRGDWRNAPENSLLAIQHCIDMGVDMVEIDVRMTKDGHLILMHDETVDRTTDGVGKVADYTLDSIRTLHLRNGLDRVTQFTIPTLEEALLLAKGKIMLNLDKCYENFAEAYAILEKTGTIDHVVMKGKIPVEQVQEEFGTYLDKVFFMPIVDLNLPDATARVKAYQEKLQPIAFEFLFNSDTLSILDQMKAIQQAGARPWVNSIYPHLCSNHDDDMAVNDLANSYDWLVAKDFNMFQTDRPELLIEYLENRGLR